MSLSDLIPRIDDDILEAMCRAHDAEDAAQRGEPSPWADLSGLIVGDNAIWAGDRIAAMRCAVEALAAVCRAMENKDE